MIRGLFGVKGHCVKGNVFRCFLLSVFYLFSTLVSHMHVRSCEHLTDRRSGSDQSHVSSEMQLGNRSPQIPQDSNQLTYCSGFTEQPLFFTIRISDNVGS